MADSGTRVEETYVLPSLTGAQHGGLGLALLIGSLFVAINIGRLLPNSSVGAALSAAPILVILTGYVAIGSRGLLRTPPRTRLFLTYALSSSLLVVSIVRTDRPEFGLLAVVLRAGLFALIVTAGYVVFCDYVQRKPARWSAMATGLLLMPALFVLVNLFLWLGGVSPPKPLYVTVSNSRLAALLGIQTSRVLFPLARGINNFGAIAGAGLVAAILYLRLGPFPKTRRVLGPVLILSSVSVLVLCDSRAALFLGVLAGAGVLVLRRIGLLKMLPGAVVVMPVANLILLQIMSFVATTPVGELLSRRPGDLETATGRVLFWGAAGVDLLNPTAQHLVGWGQYGHYTAGVSDAWAHLFASYIGEGELMSMHNATLQIIYDQGIIGLVVLLSLLWMSMRAFTTSSRPTAHALAGVLVYLMMIGTTEAVISLYFPELLILFLFLTVASAGLWTLDAQGPRSTSPRKPLESP